MVSPLPGRAEGATSRGGDCRGDSSVARPSARPVEGHVAHQVKVGGLSAEASVVPDAYPTLPERGVHAQRRCQ
eukprot:3477657-Pleurochrysis_carterae.AAC.1